MKRGIRTESITRAQRLQLVGATLHDERTIASVYTGRRTKSSVYERVTRAAAKLKLPAPPPAATGDADRAA
jgi:hypothetical protein